MEQRDRTLGPGRGRCALGWIPLLTLALPLAVLADPVETDLSAPWKDEPIDVPELDFPDGPPLQDQDAIRKAVGRALVAYEDSLHFCREQTARDVAPAGSWTISFLIRRTGHTDRVLVNGSQAPVEDTEACILATAQAWRFPELAAPQQLGRTWTFAARPVPGVPLPTDIATTLVQDAIYDSRAAKNCFAAHQQASGKLPKLATLRFTLQADGTPTDVSLLEKKLRKSELPGCLTDMLSTLALPALEEGPKVFVFPFEF